MYWILSWLVDVSRQIYMNLLLYNPFSLARIQLSSLEAFPYIQRIRHINADSFDIHHYDYEMSGDVVRTELKAKGMSSEFLKCVLSSDPLHGNGKFGLLVVYAIGCMYMCSELAFYDSEDRQWTKFGTEFGQYNDIIHYKGRFYALKEEETLEIWDYDGSFPLKVKEFKTSLKKRICDTKPSLPFSCKTRSYILESMGDILQVVRFIFNCVHEDGTTISQEEYSQLISKGDSDHKTFRSKTLLFHVYKFDFDQEDLVQVESLHDRALFLGGNHSQSFSTQDILECEKNSIFTDDLDSDACDFGIYRLEDKIIRPYICGELQTTGSPHFWVFPSLHKNNMQ